MFTLDPTRSYMMPAHFGPKYTGSKATGWYRDVTMMVVSYLTDREKLAAYLPSPFEVAEEALVTVYYARNRNIDWLAGHGYNMISVNASVVYKGEDRTLEGLYNLVMWENLTDPILAGRELQGIPKIYADIPDHEINEGVWRCQASHFDNPIVDLSIRGLRVPAVEEITAFQKEQQGKDNPMAWRYMPSIGGFGTALSEPTLFPSEAEYDEIQIGEGELVWHQLSWEQNPTQFHIVNALEALPILEYRPALVLKGKANLIVPGKFSRSLNTSAPAFTVPESRRPQPVEEIRTVSFIGAGTMGSFNSLVAALSGYQCVIYDVSEDALGQVFQTQNEIAGYLVASGYCQPSEIPEAFDRIRLETDLATATAEADLVSESVSEKLAIKRSVHESLDQLCPPGAILTTNTSSLLVSEIESAVARGDRFAALHSHLGAALWDIVAGPRTDPNTVEILKRYVHSLNGIPLVLAREHRGYVFNAMIGPVLASAMMLVVEKMASIEEVDRAWMHHRRAPMGPFGMMDLFGLNVVWDSWQDQEPEPAQAPIREKTLAFLAPYVESGKLGMKTGSGFYQYPGPAYAHPGFAENAPKSDLANQVLTSTLIRQAILLAAQEVASPHEIDRAWMAATTLDTGPFGILDLVGSDVFLSTLDQQPITAEEGEAVAGFLRTRVNAGELGISNGKGFYSYPEPLFQSENFVKGIQT
jgi:3-hydroxybutyryl-CoA dehydrogenase